MAGKKSPVERLIQRDGQTLRYCSTHQDYVPLTDPEGNPSFSTRKVSPDGLAYSCKVCERAQAAKSYQKQKKKAVARERYQDKLEMNRQQARDRYAANPEAALERGKQYRGTKKGQKVLQQASQRRRERIKQQTPDGERYTVQDIINRDIQDGVLICSCCQEHIPILERDQWHIDHITPILEGGADILANVRIIHKACNLRRPRKSQ